LRTYSVLFWVLWSLAWFVVLSWPSRQWPVLQPGPGWSSVTLFVAETFSSSPEPRVSFNLVDFLL
jgi:hypothetical protein